VPDRHDPNRSPVYAIEEAEGTDDDPAVRDVRKLRNAATGVGVILQPPKGFLDASP
jgi:hypothetical protein